MTSRFKLVLCLLKVSPVKKLKRNQLSLYNKIKVQENAKALNQIEKAASERDPNREIASERDYK